MKERKGKERSGVAWKISSAGRGIWMRLAKEDMMARLYLLSTPLYPLGNPPGLRSRFGTFEICLGKGAVWGYGEGFTVDAGYTCATGVDPDWEACK